MDKRADSRLLSIWLFIIFGMIAVVIVAGVWISYSINIELKEEEALSLNNKIIDVLVDNGYLNERVFEEDFDIIEEADLSEKLFIEDRIFYLKINILDLESDEVNTIVLGYEGFETECQLPGKDFPKCVKRIILVRRKADNKGYGLEIITGSNQKGSEF